MVRCRSRVRDASRSRQPSNLVGHLVGDWRANSDRNYNVIITRSSGAQGEAAGERSSFVLHIRPDRVDDYIAAHRNVWPEMLDALRSAGFRNYTIFRSENTVFGYFEADDAEAARSRMSSAEVQARWAVEIDGLLEPQSAAVGTAPLEEVFRLD